MKIYAPRLAKVSSRPLSMLDTLKNLVGLKPARPENPWHVTMAAVAEASGEKFVSGDDLDVLRRQQKVWDAAQAIIDAHNDTAARREFNAQPGTMADAMELGTFDAKGDAWTYLDFLEDYEQKREGGKAMQRRACQPCLPISERASAKYVAAAKRLADKLEAAERESHTTFASDLAFAPSAAVGRIRQSADVVASWTASRAPTKACGGAPRSLIPFLNF